MARALRRGLAAALGVLLLTFAGAGAAGAPLTLTQADARLNLSRGQLAYWQDASGQATLETAQAAYEAGRFTALSGPLALGYRAGTVWVHLALAVPAAAAGERWLEVEPAYLDHIDVYHRTPEGTWREHRGGDALPQHAKAIPYRGHLFPLALSPGTHELFLRVTTTSDLSVSPALWAPSAFEGYAHGLYWADGLVLGVALVLTVLNGWIFMRRRGRVEGIFVVTMVVSTLQWSAPSGLLAERLFPVHPAVANLAGAVLVCLYAAFMWVFFLILFEARRYHRAFYQVGRVVAGFSGFAALLSVFGLYPYVAPFVHGLSLMALLFLPGVFWRLWRKGRGPDRAVALALLIYATVTVLFVLRNLGLASFFPIGPGLRATPQLVFLATFQGALLVRALTLRAARQRAEDAQATAAEDHRLAQRAHEDRAQLLGLLAHELRTPVAQIDSSRQVLALLAEGAGAASGASRKPWLKMLSEAVAQLRLVFALAVDVEAQSMATPSDSADPIALSDLLEAALALLPREARARVAVPAGRVVPGLVGVHPLLPSALASVLGAGLEVQGHWQLTVREEGSGSEAGVMLQGVLQGGEERGDAIPGFLLPQTVLELLGASFTVQCQWPERRLAFELFLPAGKS